MVKFSCGGAGMLRGVNKSIIEICETENQYFEKAILFVRPGQSDKDPGFLKKKAEEYMGSVSRSAAAERTGVQTKAKGRLRILLGRYRMWVFALLMVGAYLVAQYLI